MFKGLLSFVLSIQFALNSAWKDSNCSLTFDVKTNDRLTKFPIEFQGNYTFFCPSVGDFLMDYVIIPLNTLPIGQVDDETYFVIATNTTQWRFLVNESSTIRLCAHPFNGEENDRLCREIHIGISELSHFWHLSLELFYLCILGLVSTYYLIHYIVIPRCKTRRKVQHPPRPVHRYRQTDTFEDEKVHSHMSDEE